MKRLYVLIVLGLAGVAIAATTTYNVARVAGSATVSGQNAYIVWDSTDTALIDTIYSDTIEVLESKAVNIALEYTDGVLSDSCNDSMVVIVNTYTWFPGAPKKLLYTDTFFDTNAVTTPLALKTHNFKSDTMLYQYLYFETITKDSVIMGAGIDTITLKMRYHVLQRHTD